MVKYIIILAIGVFILSFSSCGNNVTEGNEIIFPAQNVSYQLHVEPFMRFTCAYYGCHSTESRAGGRDLSSYNALVNDPINLGLVIPYQSDNSNLIRMLKRNGEYYHTFSEEWRYGPNQFEGMKKWIDEGALNN